MLGKGGQRGGAKGYEGLMIKVHCNSEEPVLVPDGGGRLPGHPAAIGAKQILRGRKAVVVHCEGIHVYGRFYRNKVSS